MAQNEPPARLALGPDRGWPLALFGIGACAAGAFNLLGAAFYQGIPTDEGMYLRMASDFWGYVTSAHLSRQPLFPMLLAPVMWISGGAFDVVARVLLSVLAGVNCVLIYLLARRVAGPLAGKVAGVAACLFPSLLLHAALLLTETPAVTLFTGTLLLLHRHVGDGRARSGVAAGILLGLSILMRAAFQFFLPFLAVALVVSRWGRWRDAAVSLACVLVPACAVCSVWIGRNLAVMGRFVPIADNGGEGLYGGNNPAVLDGPNCGTWDQEACLALAPEGPGVDRQERDRTLRDEALKFLSSTAVERPADLARLGLCKLQRAWFPSIRPGEGAARLLFHLSFWCVSVWGLAGIGMALRRWRGYLLPLAVIAGHTAQTLVFFGDTHYRVPYEPVVLSFAGLAVARGYGWMRRGNDG